MITLTFIFIAFCLRKRYLPVDAPVMMKVFYYGVSVILTPLLGIPVFKWLNESKNVDSDGKPFIAC